MHKRLLLSFALFAALFLSGCVTETPEPSRVRVGMSRDDLRFFFGEPLRIEKVDAGGEVWFYREVTRTGPRMDGAAWQDADTGSGGVDVTVSPSPRTRQECPIYLSPEGRVIEPLPQAVIRGR